MAEKTPIKLVLGSPNKLAEFPAGDFIGIAAGGTGATTASGARTALGVDAAGTDNSTPVTLAGTPNYLTLAGQTITLGSIDLATDTTGTLALASGGTGATTASAARAALGVDAAGTDNSTDVSLAGAPNYLTLAGQVVTLGLIDLGTDTTGTLALASGGTGSTTASGARAALGVDVAGTDNSTNVSLGGTLDYLTLAGQVLTLGAIDLATDTTGTLALASGGTGATTASAARTALGVDAAGTVNYSHPNHSGDVTSVADGAQTIANSVVTNAKLADMAANTIKLRNAGTSGVAGDATITSLTEELTPTSGHMLLAEVGGALRRIDVGNLPTGGGGESNTGSNVGTAGVGIFKGKVGIDLQYKKINAGSTKVSITDDTVNDEVDVDIVVGNILTSTLNNDAGWTANSSDAALLSRANHTGTQLLSTISDSGALASLSTVGTAEIDNSAVTLSKMADMATSSILGRATALSGVPEVLTAAQVRTIINVADGANAYSHPNHSGDVTSTGDGAQTIAAGVVTNAKLADMAANTIKLRNAGTTGSAGDATITSLTEELTPTSGHMLLAEVGGSLRKIDVGNLPTGGGGESNTGSNVGTAGVGIFKGKVGIDLQYKKLNAGSSKVTITDDTLNDEVDVDVVPANIATSTLSNDAGWTANSSDAALLSRANHTGTQLLSTISDSGALAALATVGTAEIDNSSVSLAKMADILQDRILGRATASTGAPESLTGAQVRTILNVADGATANSSDATLLARANHTGTQLLSTISDSGALAALSTVGTAEIDALAVTSAELASGSVQTAKIQDAAVTLAKMADMATASFIGRNTAATGVPEVLNKTTALSILNVADGATANSSDAALLSRANHTGTQTLSTISDSGALAALSTVGTAQIDALAVTSAELAANAVQTAKIQDANVTLAKLANMATASFIGRSTAATGVPEILSKTQALAILNVADGATANSSDATLLSRANHTGTQLLSTISDSGALAALATVGTAQIDALAVTSAELAANAVTTAKITDKNVTLAKLPDMATDSFLGRDTTGTGVTEVLSASAVRAILGVTTTAGASDSGKLVGLDSSGEVNEIFMNKGDFGEKIVFPTYETNKIQSGAGAPGDGVGKTGDRYIDETSGDLYVKELGTAITYPLSPTNGTPIDYTPSDVASASTSDANQRANVFLPTGTAPTSGFPWVLYCAAGSFDPTAPNSTITENSRVAGYLNKGIAVVSIGVTGRSTSSTNFLWEPGSSGFDSYVAADFFPEKDAIWALQYFKKNASANNLDPTRIAIDGVSSGAHTVAYGALGKSEESLFTGSDTLLNETWDVQAAVLLELPTWYDAYKSTTGAPIADHFRTAGGVKGTTLADIPSANLKEGSLDFRVRESGASITTTPIFLAYDEGLRTEVLTRTGTVPNNDPDLSDTLDSSTELHAAFHGYSLIGAISTAQSTNKLTESFLYVQRGVQYRNESHNAISNHNAASSEIFVAAADFLELHLNPGLWVSKGNISGVVQTADIEDKAVTLAKIQDESQLTMLGRANAAGTGVVTELTPIQIRRIAFDGTPTNSVIATGSSTSVVGGLAIPTDGFMGRQGSGNLVGATIPSGGVVYRPSGGSLGTQTLVSAMLDVESGTSFPSSPAEGTRFYRTDLDAGFYYDSSRSKWLSYTHTANLTFARNNWSNGQAGNIGGLGVGSNSGWPIPWDCTVVAASIRKDTTTTAAYQVKKRDNASTVVTTALSTVTATSTRAATDDTMNDDVDKDFSIIVLGQTASITGAVFVDVKIQRRAA